MKKRLKITNKTMALLSVSFLLTLLLSLTACSSSPIVDTTQTTATTEENSPDGNIAEANSEIATDIVLAENGSDKSEEITLEETTEVISKPVVYEGIDMESTLSGVEWMENFVGIIDEPKFVVFNDETNKKLIIEDGQIISFEKTDTIAVYLPEGYRYMSSGGGLADQGMDYIHTHVFVKLNMERLAKETKRLAKSGGAKFYVILDNNGEEQQLNCRLSLVE